MYTLYKNTERLKRAFKSKITPMGSYVLAIAALALVFGLNTHATMLYQLTALLLAFLCVSFPLSFRFSSQLTLSRSLAKTCTVGKRLSYTLLLTNNGEKTVKGLSCREFSPDYLPTSDEFLSTPEPEEEKRNVIDRKLKYHRWLWLLRRNIGARFPTLLLEDFDAGEKREIEVFFTATKRGYLHLQGICLERAEAMGIFKKELRIQDEQNILVLPRTYPISDVLFEGSRKYHQGGISSAAQYGDSQEFTSLREYQSGDSVRHIDWKATARSQKPILRQYQDEYFSRYGIILDTFTSLDSCPLFEEAVSVAASIVIKESFDTSVIDLLFAGNTFVSTTTMGKGIAEQQYMLEVLATITNCRDTPFTELTNLVKNHTALLSGVILVLIDMDENRRDLITYLQEMKIPFQALLISSSSQHSNEVIKRYNLDFLVKVIDLQRKAKEIRFS